MFRDNGDFLRLIQGMLQTSGQFTPPGQHIWQFLPGPWKAPDHFELAWYVFEALGRIQRWLVGHYDLRITALLAQIVLLGGLYELSRACADKMAYRLAGRTCLFAVFCAVVAQAYNVGMLASFYSEFVFFLALPFLLTALVRSPSSYGVWALAPCACIAGLAKVQYFYLPALVGLCILALAFVKNGSWASTPRVGYVWLAASLVCAQIVCLLPIGHNNYAQLNYYHSLYLGSYMVEPPDQLEQLGLSQRQMACVGVDAWNNRLVGTGGGDAHNVGEGHTCFDQASRSLQTVLRPYLRDPAVLVKLALYALPVHFTVDYFHVYRNFSYVLDTSTDRLRTTEWAGPSIWRTHLLTGYVAVVLVASGLLLPWFLRREYGGVRMLILFLALFIVSQIGVSLLGEGLRDLSKHLWAAQLCLDFLAVVLLFLLLRSTEIFPRPARTLV